MQTIGTPGLWSVFAVIIGFMLTVDLLLQGKRGSRQMSFRQAACWSLLWISLSLFFAAGLWGWLNHTAGSQVASTQTIAFLTGYLLEKALAIDNVFVWLMLFSYFAIPHALQQRVLVYGVLGAIILRTIMIFAGSWLINEFSWILYVFGAFLLLTGCKMLFHHTAEGELENNRVMVWLRQRVRMTDRLHGERFFIRQASMRYATPLFLALIMVEISDVIFAVDSIPAIFAVTADPFIVLTSNLFAILGLRAMYFLLASAAERFSLLKYGLAIILIFIGIKMLVVNFWHIPMALSLGVIVGILIITIIINQLYNRHLSR